VNNRETLGNVAILATPVLDGVAALPVG